MPIQNYENYRSWKSWSEQNFGSFSLEDSLYFSNEFRMAGVPTIAGKNVVEYGFGNGSFAGWAIKNKASYIGTEVIPELVERAVQHSITAFHFDNFDLDLCTPSGTDLVVAFDVFEHFDTQSLKDEFIRIKSLLVSGGILIARVPSGDSPFSRAIQYGDITHRSVLGSSAIRQLAEEVGLHVKAIREPAFPLWGLGTKTLIRRGLVLLVRKLLFPLIKHALMGNKSAVVSPNMIFILAKT